MAGVGDITKLLNNKERLTEWEKHQLEGIGLVFQQAINAIKTFEEEDKKFRKQNTETLQDNKGSDWLKFRNIMIDLYSVLDYTYFLLHCHFFYKGTPDQHHSAAMHVGFPYEFNGVPFQESSSKYNEEQKRKFIKDNIKFFSGETTLQEGTHFWEIIGDAIFAVQPKLPMKPDPDDQSKILPTESGRQIPQGDAECFAILHHFRNCTTHRGLIRFHNEDMLVEINHNTREIKIVQESEKQEDNNFYHVSLPKGYCIQIPKDIRSTKSKSLSSFRLLVEVLDGLLKFVKNTTSELLSAAFLLESMQPDLLKHFKVVDFQPLPQVSLKMNDDVLALEDQLKEEMKAVNLTVEPAEFKPVAVENKHFKGSYKLTISNSEKNFLTITSKEYKNRSQDDVKKAGLEEVIRECIRLGIIVVT